MDKNWNPGVEKSLIRQLNLPAVLYYVTVKGNPITYSFIVDKDRNKQDEKEESFLITFINPYDADDFRNEYYPSGKVVEDVLENIRGVIKQYFTEEQGLAIIKDWDSPPDYLYVKSLHDEDFEEAA